MGRAGKGKAGQGSAGGKGLPRGGKGQLVDPLLEVAAGDDWAGELLDGAIDAAAAELDEWALGGAIYSVTAAPLAAPCAAASSASSRLAPKTFAIQPAPYKTFPTTAAAASASSRLAKTFSETALDTAAAASASRRLAPYKTFSGIAAAASASSL